MSEWTAESPATSEEIEAELQKYRGQTLNVTSWGGAYQPAQRVAYFEPFQQKFGIQIIEEYPVNFSRLRSMVEAGNVTWDVADSSTRDLYPLGTEGLLEELTPAIHNRYLPHLPRVAQTPWGGGGGVLWATGLAYRLDGVDTLWERQAAVGLEGILGHGELSGQKVVGRKSEREHLLCPVRAQPRGSRKCRRPRQHSEAHPRTGGPVLREAGRDRASYRLLVVGSTVTACSGL